MLITNEYLLQPVDHLLYVAGIKFLTRNHPDTEGFSQKSRAITMPG